jgi:uncharacterized OB-fold protein
MEDFMSRLQSIHRLTNEAFQRLIGEKCSKCGEKMSLVVPMKSCAFLICGKCKNRVIKSM